MIELIPYWQAKLNLYIILLLFFSVSTTPQRPSYGHKRTSSEIQEATGLDLSLAQAFVAFLQTESSPKEPVKLPLRGASVPPSSAAIPEDLNSSHTVNSSHILNSSTTSTSSHCSGRSTPTSAIPTLGVINPNFATPNNESNQRSETSSPVLLSSSVVAHTSAASLPTFSVSRSSSAILRQVLQEDDTNQ